MKMKTGTAERDHNVRKLLGSFLKWETLENTDLLPFYPMIASARESFKVNFPAVFWHLTSSIADSLMTQWNWHQLDQIYMAIHLRFSRLFNPPLTSPPLSSLCWTASTKRRFFFTSHLWSRRWHDLSCFLTVAVIHCAMCSASALHSGSCTQNQEIIRPVQLVWLNWASFFWTTSSCPSVTPIP